MIVNIVKVIIRNKVTNKILYYLIELMQINEILTKKGLMWKIHLLVRVTKDLLILYYEQVVLKAKLIKQELQKKIAKVLTFSN